MTLLTAEEPALTWDKFILCCYFNNTGKVQVARISNIENWYFERVVFPGDRLLFEAPSAAELEIHCALNGSISCDRMACESLQVYQESEEIKAGV